MGKLKFEVFLHEKDVTKVYKRLQVSTPSWRWDDISIGWCGWANADDCWWLRTKLKPKEIKALVDWIFEEGIRTYDPMKIK